MFPPWWYFPAVPADLSHTGGALEAWGHDVHTLDLSGATQAALVGSTAGWKALRDPATYPGGLASAGLALHQAFRSLPTRARLRPATLTLEGDPDDLRVLRAHGLDPAHNPALPVLTAAARQITQRAPDVVGITLVHPDQKAQGPVLARLLRDAGYTGIIALYGSLEDVVAPSDFAPDLLGGHLLFDDVDGVIVGEAESALRALLEGTPVPNWVTRETTVLPQRYVEDLGALGAPRFADVVPAHHPTPTPVIDLRLGRGCPWARCAFCAIQAHQPGYRASAAARVGAAAEAAHAALGSTHFRVRDDLVTPRQLRELAEAFRELPFATWCARSRFEPALSREVLQNARDAGLSELWLGLESGSERIRASMDKGVRSEVVERIVLDCAALGIRVRALVILGFPGETEADFLETEAFLTRHGERLCGMALTPFQLMRRSPMADALERFGLHAAEDPLPAHVRLRHHVPVQALDPDPVTVKSRFDRIVRAHAHRGHASGGLGPVHAWWDATAR